MKKVFVFWGMVLVILSVGAIATVYGKILLKEENRRAEVIIQELAAIAEAETVKALVAESYKSPESVGMPDMPETKENKTGPMPPHRHELPTMPRFSKPSQKLIHE